MIPSADEQWSYDVNKVFSSKPRNGNNTAVWWWRRKSLEEKMERELNAGVQICLDGPTGTGKSSLAITLLERRNIDYSLLQVTINMDWPQFCVALFAATDPDDTSVATEFDVGIDRGLPTLKAKFSRKQDDTANLGKRDLGHKLSWTEHNVCDYLVQLQLTLVIDDFEKASESLVVRIADMIKLMSQSYAESNAKIVIIGTDDIFRRLVGSDLSLRDRLYEISVGTVPHDHSWKFLLSGFERLGIEHPAELNKKYPLEVTKEDLVECQRRVFTAADGLPKALNRLGRQVCLQTTPSRLRLTPSDITTVCNEMARDNTRDYLPEISRIIRHIAADEPTIELLRLICLWGSGNIHSWHDIVSSLRMRFEEPRVEEAARHLIEVSFLIRTGARNEIVMVKDPHLAHVLAQYLRSDAGKQMTLQLSGKR